MGVLRTAGTGCDRPWRLLKVADVCFQLSRIVRKLYWERTFVYYSSNVFLNHRDVHTDVSMETSEPYSTVLNHCGKLIPHAWQLENSEYPSSRVLEIFYMDLEGWLELVGIYPSYNQYVRFFSSDFLPSTSPLLMYMWSPHALLLRRLVSPKMYLVVYSLEPSKACKPIVSPPILCLLISMVVHDHGT